ncbi:uncharacterized protein LOC135818477 [Sycon ciliatum]|uniref:uncharacterized protein LOC135818477 n=1 Tax=Sycon ciliatum TaxID=27933 RepID=UPI0020AA7800
MMQPDERELLIGDVERPETQAEKTSFLDKWKEAATQKAFEWSSNILSHMVHHDTVKVKLVDESCLEHGCHIAMPKTLSMMVGCSVPPSLQDRIMLFHHGIVIRNGSSVYVISYTDPGDDYEPDHQLLGTGSEQGGIEETDGDIFGDWRRQLTYKKREGLIKLLNRSVVRPERYCIIVQPLSEFSYQGKYIQYNYGGGDAEYPDGATLSLVNPCRPEMERKNAAAVARFFLKHPQAFGHYSMCDWNCENFATFARTTTLTAAELEAKFAELQRSGRTAFSQAYLEENSETSSRGITRYLEQGLKVIFTIVEIDLQHDCSPPSSHPSSSSEEEDSEGSESSQGSTPLPSDTDDSCDETPL